MLDPTISLGFKPTVALNTPEQSIAGAIQLRDLMQNQQLRRQQIQKEVADTARVNLENEQAKRDAADNVAVQSAWSDPEFHKAVASAATSDPTALGSYFKAKGQVVQPSTQQKLTTWGQQVVDKTLAQTENEQKLTDSARKDLVDVIGASTSPDPNQLTESLRGWAARHPEYAAKSGVMDAAKNLTSTNRDEVLDHITNTANLGLAISAAATKKKEDEAKALKAQQDVKTSGVEGQSKELSLAGQTVSSVADQPSWETWRATLSPELQARVPVQFSPENKQAVIRMSVPSTETFKVSVPPGLEGYYLGKKAQEAGKTVDQLTPAEVEKFLGQYKQDNQDPDLKAARLASEGLSNAVKQIALNQQPTQDQAADLAKDIVNHHMAPSQLNLMAGSFGTAGAAFKRMVSTEVHKLDPNFDFEQAESEYGLAKSPQFQNTVRNMDSVTKSLDKIQTAANSLNNSKVKSLTELINAGKTQFNNIDLGKFQTDKTLVSEEVGRLLAGGGTGNGTSDKKLEMAGALLKDTDDPALIAAKIGEIKDLLGYRRKSLTRGTYMENVSPSDTSTTTVPAKRKPLTDIFKK